ncbi:MAG: molybdenum cofactor guanylyltransferase [Candidatus Zixiibacteriota bacterium]|nr:MAG: molybdenum cofactor guanylyltransferase [candidate division Zixibacteria bacterium]
MQKASGIILAGGKGSRINKNKALITLPDGKALIQRTIGVLKGIFTEILIVANQRETYKGLGVQVVEDLIEGKGPLGGILTGLAYSTSQFNFVIGCDMPFPQPGLIELLLQKCVDQDVVIPAAGGEVEPLFAVYSKSCLPVIVGHVQKQDLKVRSILTELRVLKIEQKRIDGVDPERLSFFNINTDDDLKKARAMMLARNSGQ